MFIALLGDTSELGQGNKKITIPIVGSEFEYLTPKINLWETVQVTQVLQLLILQTVYWACSFFYQYLCLYMLCDILAVTAVLIRILEIRYCMVNLVIMYEWILQNILLVELKN